MSESEGGDFYFERPNIKFGDGGSGERKMVGRGGYRPLGIGGWGERRPAASGNAGNALPRRFPRTDCGAGRGNEQWVQDK